MIHTQVWHLVNYSKALARLTEQLRERRESDRQGKPPRGQFSENDRSNFIILFGDLEPWLRGMMLAASLDRLLRIQGVLDPDPEEHDYARTDDLIIEVKVFLETLEDELKRRMFMVMTTEEAALYTDPYKAFPKTVKAFPSSAFDIIGASRCYAVGEATACVFHCMGIAQVGLHALANEFKTSIDLENWQNIIERIESAIEKLQDGPKGLVKDSKLKSYSAIAVQFRYFKDAWRNHLCHFRAHYDIHQARSIFTHVTDFIEEIAEQI